MSLRSFTDEEMRLLARVIEREKKSIVNTPSRPSQDRSYDENQDWLAPEVYIAKPNSEISARRVGTGTGLRSNDIAGFGNADVYRIVLDDDGNPRLVTAFESNRRIHNLSDNAITLGFITILRDKYGNWIALPLSAGTQIVRFVVDSVMDDTVDGLTAALCTVLSKTCGIGVTGTTGTGGGSGLGELEQIVVVDALGCLFDEAAVDLEAEGGRKGYAAYMDALDYRGTGTGSLDTGTGTGPASDECRWECIALCCPP